MAAGFRDLLAYLFGGTGSAPGTVVSTGTLSVTLDDITLSATGNVIGLGTDFGPMVVNTMRQNARYKMRWPLERSAR